MENKIEKQIKEIVNKYRVLNEKIEKSDDIQTNIRNNYYYNQKYKYITASTDEYKNIIKEVEQLVIKQGFNSLKEINDMFNEVKKYVFSILNKKIYWNNDTLENDIEAGIWTDIPEDIKKKMWNLMYEISPDTINKPLFAQDIKDLVEFVMNK